MELIKKQWNKKDVEEFDEFLYENRLEDKIDFTKREYLDDLYTRLKLYKNDMSEETVKYANILFKYCERNYINKN